MAEALGIFGTPTGLGYSPGNIDLASQMQEIERQRQLANALLAKTLQTPTEEVGGGMYGPIAVRRSPLEMALRFGSGLGSQSQLSDLAGQQRGIVQGAQQRMSTSLSNLLQGVQPDAGVGATATEQPGPPSPDQANSFLNPVTSLIPGAAGIDAATPDTPGAPPSPIVTPGHGPTLDPAKFGAAYAQAQAAGVDPAILSHMLNQFQGNQMLLQMPGMAGFVPGATSPGSSQPSTAEHGASVTLPYAGAPGGGAAGDGMSSNPIVAMSDPRVQMAMAAIGGPAAMAKTASEVNKPVDMKPGNTMATPYGGPMFSTPDAHGNYIDYSRGVPVVKSVQGFTAARAGQVTSEEIAKIYSAQDVAVPNGAGGTTIVPAWQYAHLPPPGSAEQRAMLAGGGPQAGAAPGGANFGATPNNPTFNGRSGGSNVPGAANQQGARYAYDNEVDPAARAAIARDNPGARLPIYTGTPPAPEASATTLGAPGYADAEAMKEQGKSLGKLRETTATDSVNAGAQISRNNQMQLLSQYFTPGATATVRGQAAGYVRDALSGMGVDKSRADSIVNGFVNGGPGALEALQAFQHQAIPNAFAGVKAELGGASGGRIGQQEVLLYAANSPNPNMQQGAIKLMTDFSNGVAQWKIAKQSALTDYKGNDPGKFEQWWNQQNPLAKYVPSEAAMRQTLGIAPNADLSGQAHAPVRSAQGAAPAADWTGSYGSASQRTQAAIPPAAPAAPAQPSPAPHAIQFNPATGKWE